MSNGVSHDYITKRAAPPQDASAVDAIVIDRRNGATDDRRYGASLKRLKRAISGGQEAGDFTCFGRPDLGAAGGCFGER